MTSAWRLPGTREAFRSGVLRRSKAEIIARAAAVLDAAEARAAEALVLGRAGTLSPGGLRAAIARAVLQVAPGKARRRREKAARDARVERWPEDSGNAALAGRELPPAKVLAADQRITWWARQLKAAGLAGSMDELRARAFLDLLLDIDSRPPPGADSPPPDLGARPVQPGGPATDTTNGPGVSGPGDDEPGPPHPAGPHAPPGSGVRPAGFTGRNHLTVPLATPAGPAGPARGSPSPPPASPARQAGTGPGGSPPGPPASGPCSSPSTRSPSISVTTGSRPPATTLAPSCGTSRRSGMPPAPARCAAGLPPARTSSTTPPTRRAD